MKKFFIPFFLIAIATILTGCIREEALGSECDITGVEETWLASLPEGLLVGNPVVKNRSVTFMVSADANVTALAPKFHITHGASIFFVNESGSAIPYDAVELIDFTLPQTFRVVSEDGCWQKDYEVSFELPRPLDVCDFEDFSYNDANQYQRLLWRQTDGSLNASLWDSGNAGYAFTGQAKTPLNFPSTFVNEDNPRNGRYARLRTHSTGAFGTAAGMPIAAGNLFIGEFQVRYAVTNPLKATRFGFQIVKDEPVSIEGWYRYTPGETMTGGEPGEIDECDIYAVLFEVTPGAFEPLYGDNVRKSERIVALAELGDGSARNDWTHFVLPFRTLPGKKFDENTRRNGGYAMTIVMTSSHGGAFFRGAVGSTLCVDDLKINWKNE